VTFTVQNTATQTAALGGQNSEPIQLKQSININIAGFSGNQVYIFDKVYGSCVLSKTLLRCQPQIFTPDQ